MEELSDLYENVYCVHCQRIYPKHQVVKFKGQPYCKFDDCDGDLIDLHPVSPEETDYLLETQQASMSD